MTYREELEKFFSAYLQEFQRQYMPMLRKALQKLEKQVGEIPEEELPAEDEADVLTTDEALKKLEGTLSYLEGKVEDEVNSLADLIKSYIDAVKGDAEKHRTAMAMVSQTITNLVEFLNKFKETL